jgi:hypothetical protein
MGEYLGEQYFVRNGGYRWGGVEMGGISGLGKNHRKKISK